LPKILDEDQMFVKCNVKEQNQASLPSFVNFNEELKKFTFKPINLKEIRTYTI